MTVVQERCKANYSNARELWLVGPQMLVNGQWKRERRDSDVTSQLDSWSTQAVILTFPYKRRFENWI